MAESSVRRNGHYWGSWTTNDRSFAMDGFPVWLVYLAKLSLPVLRTPAVGVLSAEQAFHLSYRAARMNLSILAQHLRQFGRCTAARASSYNPQPEKLAYGGFPDLWMRSKALLP